MDVNFPSVPLGLALTPALPGAGHGCSVELLEAPALGPAAGLPPGTGLSHVAGEDVRSLPLRSVLDRIQAATGVPPVRLTFVAPAAAAAASSPAVPAPASRPPGLLVPASPLQPTASGSGTRSPLKRQSSLQAVLAFNSIAREKLGCVW